MTPKFTDTTKEEPTIKPEKPTQSCGCCGSNNWWQLPCKPFTWVCQQCHPNPNQQTLPEKAKLLS